MIQVYDTTLRDGTQRKDISLSCNDKLNIARRLDDLGITFIEGGWPGSNPKDAEFFDRAKKMTWKSASIAAFGSTCGVNHDPSGDANIQALLDAETPVCTVVGKSAVRHVREVIRTTLDNNLRMIEQSVAYLRSKGRRVVYDGEHFFDGYVEDPEYALETLRAAGRGGAETVVLCETNGGMLPWQVAEIVQAVSRQVQIPLGIHAHNDTECAVANTLVAVREGCVQVQGTINGYGERCGNANLCSIIPNLAIKMGLHVLPEGKLPQLSEVSHYVSEVANLTPYEQLPYVGKAAFTHKGGIHVAAIRRNPDTYQHIDPSIVGNQMDVVVSELSGKGNLLSKLETHGIQKVGDEQAREVLKDIKRLESQGFSFEAAEASVVMMYKRLDKDYQPPFSLIDFSASVEHRDRRGLFAEATVKVMVNGELIHTVAEGNGPVNSLDKALRKALVDHYPAITAFHLSDYKVRILDGKSGTSAITRVLIETQNGNRSWSTVGASANIIEASWQALVDAVEYGLSIS